MERDLETSYTQEIQRLEQENSNLLAASQQNSKEIDLLHE
jgi:hypothetical protein